MWLDVLKERRKELGYTVKYISIEAKLPERTVSRIFSGETASPYMDTIIRIADILDIPLDELFGDSKTVVGGKNYAILHEEVDKLTAEVERLNSELALLSAENNVQKDKLVVLTAENDVLRLKLEHKEEIIALHNYYNKRQSND
jgi:transcriptional regulator with XRE-family HTH domain